MPTLRLAHPTAASLLLALLLSSCTEKKDPVIPAPTPQPTAANSETRDFTQYTELMWSDEFSGSGSLDPTKWDYNTGGGGWGNQELEVYTTSTDNVNQTGGNLVIQPRRQGTSPNFSYTSGRVLTKGRQNFQFGRIDVRAKLPQTQGIWPAIWMLGSDIDQNNWPKCGEIDIMELRGQTPTEILSTMHYADNAGNHQQSGIERVKLPNGASFADDFHVFSVVRSLDQTRFYLDGQLYYSLTKSNISQYPYPFNNNFFVVLNVAVGGNFLGNPDATTTFPQQMLVDYVRFYQYKS
jgi:beta-glucanase (GH16 family)